MIVRRILITTFATTFAALLGVFGCGGDNGSGPGPSPPGGPYSFETDLEGWEPDATDLVFGGSEAIWSITRSQELAADGATSLRLYVVNLSDAAKIWIEQPFALEPNTTYDVDIEYAFATADYGLLNLFTIVTGVLQSSPEDAGDLAPTFQGTTSNGASSDVGYQWLRKRYQFTAESGAVGRLYVVIGVWGTYEVTRTYYVDDVRISFTPR